MDFLSSVISNEGRSCFVYSQKGKLPSRKILGSEDTLIIAFAYCGVKVIQDDASTGADLNLRLEGF